MRDNLAGIRGNVNPKYAARIDNGEIEQQFVKYYSKQFLANHSSESKSESILTDKEKSKIVNTISNLVVKDEQH